MTRNTLARKLRNFDFLKDNKGQIQAVPRETPHPPMKSQKQMVKCGIYEIPVMVSPGQIINEYKICKRFKKEKLNEDMKRYGKK